MLYHHEYDGVPSEKPLYIPTVDWFDHTIPVPAQQAVPVDAKIGSLLSWPIEEEERKRRQPKKLKLPLLKNKNAFFQPNAIRRQRKSTKLPPL